MYVDKRNARTGIDPRSATIALVLNGAAIAALIFVTPEIVRDPPRPPLVTTNIPLDPPPEPLPPKPTPRTKLPPADIVSPKLIFPIPHPIDNGPVAVFTPTPTTIPSDGNGEATGTATATPTPTPSPTLVDATFDPRYARDLQPDYPAEETRAQREGRVVVRVLIGIDGRVKRVERTSATSDAFFRATERQALAHWRFRPATRGGVPEEAWRTMAIRFVLQGG